METITQSPAETEKLGQKVGNWLIQNRKNNKKAVVLALEGQLGSGKTTFTQGLANGLGIKKRVISPTFILMRSYRLSVKNKAFKNLYHLDLYRLEENIDNELATLGFFDLFDNPCNILLVEWADKARDFLPQDTIWVNFETLGEGERKITIKNL